MSPLATTLLCAIRYAHGRSLHPYEDVVAAFRMLWPHLDPHSQEALLGLLRRQVPGDLARLIRASDSELGSPCTRGELEAELDAYIQLFAWCEQHMVQP